MKKIIVAAMSEDRVIGLDDKLPWKIPQELKYFKESTMGGTLIMGRKTFDSIGKVLPGRTTIVVTRDKEWGHFGAIPAHSIDEAFSLARTEEVFIVGGGKIYEQTLPVVDELRLSVIAGSYKGDTWFPEIDSDWKLYNIEEYDEFRVEFYGK